MASGKKWRESDTIKFVELYENAECLWNFRHPAYKHRNARDKAIQDIIEKMNLPDFGVNELKNKIKNIRSTYQQEVNKIRRSKQEFAGDIIEEYKTNLAWFPIADRFLGTVINSAKLTPKTEEEDSSSFFQPHQPALYNLVETEMNGEVDDEIEEKFTPLTISIGQIKEEVLEKEDYVAPMVTHHHNIKKRRISQHQPTYEGSNHSFKSEEPETPHFHQNPSEDTLWKDEWYHFGNNIACQLRNLPLERALVCQRKIIDILTQERIDCITKSKSEVKM